MDDKFKTKGYYFIKHEGTLMIFPRRGRDSFLLKHEFENQFYEEPYSIEYGTDGYYICCYPVNTYDELNNVLSYCIKLGCDLDLSFDEFFKLSELMLIDDAPVYQKLKEFDLRDCKFTYLDCKIKNIRTPKLTFNGKKYTQNITIYDDTTEKTINAILHDRSAAFDSWKNGDHVQIIGAYTPEANTIPLIIYEAIKIEESDEPTQITRETKTPGYDQWRKNILSKDNQKCVCCGLDKHLQVHHLYGYKEHPELAIHPDNGVTLCHFCHDKYHSIYGLKNINPRDFIDFMKRFGRWR